jgi:O-6-methylguanine DNA methyltransferase
MLPNQIKRIASRLDAVFVPGRNAITDETERQLADYFNGQRSRFDLPLQPCGTDFQRTVWDALGAIPYGDRCSYADIAEAVGRPAAVRAVGTANGMNAIAIVIPCHRVVGADGRLAGYGGGLWRKQRLLDLEEENALVAKRV